MVSLWHSLLDAVSFVPDCHPTGTDEDKEHGIPLSVSSTVGRQICPVAVPIIFPHQFPRSRMNGMISKVGWLAITNGSETAKVAHESMTFVIGASAGLTQG